MLAVIARRDMKLADEDKRDSDKFKGRPDKEHTHAQVIGTGYSRSPVARVLKAHPELTFDLSSFVHIMFSGFAKMFRGQKRNFIKRLVFHES